MARFSVDLLDDAYFPRHGELFTLQWNGPRESLGADANADRLSVDWTHARSYGRNTLVLSAAGGAHVSGPTNQVQDFYTLGGLFDLSGLSPDEISGPQFGIARAIMYRRIGSGQDGLFDVPTYLGFSVELGNVWQRRSDVSVDSALAEWRGFPRIRHAARAGLRGRRLRRGRRPHALPAARPHPLTRAQDGLATFS